jgi:uncharacterized protein
MIPGAGIARLAMNSGNLNADGLMRRREASINDVPIRQADRLFHWPLGPCTADHSGLSELGL